VYALGARYGEGKSMSAGVVSGLGRAIPAPTGNRIYGVIQVGASVGVGGLGYIWFECGALASFADCKW